MSVYETVTPGPGGMVRWGLSPDALLEGPPDEFFAEVSRRPRPLRVDLPVLPRVPVLGLAAVARKSPVAVWRTTRLAVAWAGQHDLVWRSWVSREFDPEHPLYRLAAALPPEAAPGLVELSMAVFDPALWPAKDRVLLLPTAAKVNAGDRRRVQTPAEFLDDVFAVWAGGPVRVI